MGKKPRFEIDPNFPIPSPQEAPEKQLIAALLDRVLRDLCEPAADILDIHRQTAFEYAYSPDSYPYTFIWCCEELDLQPEHVLNLAESHGLIFPRKWRIDTRASYQSLVDFELSSLVPAWIPKRNS